MDPWGPLAEDVGYQVPGSPAHSERSFYSHLVGFQDEGNFSDFEQESLDRPPFRGLFNPALHYWPRPPLLATAHLGKDSKVPQPPTDCREQDDFLFTEQAIEVDTIPIPRMFLEMIRRQWASLTMASQATRQENFLFRVHTDLLNLI